MKFADVAPLVRAPLHAAGRPNSSCSHATATCSIRIANGELTQLNAIWSIALVHQSAASAAGVPPPITKWKNRGPAERVAPSEAASISSRTAASEPSPVERQRPPERAAGLAGPAGAPAPRRARARYRVASSVTSRKRLVERVLVEERVGHVVMLVRSPSSRRRPHTIPL